MDTPSENVIEYWLERVIFASRWLLAPLYLGLALVLLAFVARFFIEMAHLIQNLLTTSEANFVLLVLSLVDVVLVANLVLMVLISGYENFVSKINIAGEKLSWLGKLDSGSLKIKVASSIVAISSIHLLRAFMNVEQLANDKVMWLVLIHLTFVISAMMLAYLDKLAFQKPG